VVQSKKGVLRRLGIGSQTGSKQAHHDAKRFTAT
jgi:hypothetical protein